MFFAAETRTESTSSGFDWMGKRCRPTPTTQIKQIQSYQNSFTAEFITSHGTCWNRIGSFCVALSIVVSPEREGESEFPMWKGMVV